MEAQVVDPPDPQHLPCGGEWLDNRPQGRAQAIRARDDRWLRRLNPEHLSTCSSKVRTLSCNWMTPLSAAAAIASTRSWKTT
jgi:hypothetical protein